MIVRAGVFACVLGMCAQLTGCATNTTDGPQQVVVPASALSNAGVLSSNWRVCSDCTGVTAKTAEDPVPATPMIDTARALQKQEPRPEVPEIWFAAAFFDVGQALLKPEGREALLALLPKAKAAKLIGVAGRTDPTGAERFNSRLAAARAKVAVKLLVEHGVDRAVIKVVTEVPARTPVRPELVAGAPLDENGRKRRVDIAIVPR